jgi:drug/metabolite transporter (DMT)-like permease
VIVLGISVLALGHATSASQVGGVALVVGGVLLVRGLSRADAGGLAFGIAIACCIAGYTLVDKSGIEHANPVTYLELSMAVPTVAYAGAVAHAKGAGAIRAAVGPAAVTAGIATFVAYAFVLAALERASAASVSAVRETSVVIAAALAAAVLKERVTRWRFLGAITVVVGIAFLR